MIFSIKALSFLSFYLLHFPTSDAQNFVNPSTGDLCYALNFRSTILDDVLYMMGGQYTFLNGDTNSEESNLYYLNLTQSFPVEGFIPAANLHSVQLPHGVPFNGTGAFFVGGSTLYSYSPEAAEADTVIGNTMWAYDTSTGLWADTTIPGGTFNIEGRNDAFHATIPETGMGYYLSPDSGSASANLHIEGMIEFNASDPFNLHWTNQTKGAPQIDSGTLEYVRMGASGILVAIGGYNTSSFSDEFASSTCCYGTRDMSIIDIYDISSSTWYSVTATGDIPTGRVLICSAVSASPDDSSFQITIFGGFSLLNPEAGFNDVYVLTIPSFRWIQVDDTPASGFTSTSSLLRAYPNSECQSYNDRQMIAIGGYIYDPSVGVHQANGNSCNTSYASIRVLDTSTYTWQIQFQPNLAAYTVPEVVYNVIGGDSSGGATVKAPSGGFSNAALQSIFSQTVARAATATTASTSTPMTSKGSSTTSPTAPTPGAVKSASPSSSGVSAGILIGAIIGGLAIITGLGGLYWYVRRRSRSPDFPAGIKCESGGELPSEMEASERGSAPVRSRGEQGKYEAAARQELPGDNLRPVELPTNEK